ncbi:MAG: hypothetical protein ACI8T6_001035 [Candidatus Poseidoniaceae archaeon]|jgi:hypothetical protein
MDESALSQHSVAELKVMLRSQGLAVSGNKSLLIERLVTSGSRKSGVLENISDVSTTSEEEPLVNLSLEQDFEGPMTFKQRMSTTVYGPLNLGGLVAIGLALLMVTATVFIIQPAWLGFEPDYDYELIDFDQAQAQTFAQNLVDFGHPEWEGRMSGTDEEANAATYIESEFKAMGMVTQLNQYQVPMHYVEAEPSLQVCIPNGFGQCDGFTDILNNAQVTTFQHRVDYVIQGFSGRSQFAFGDDVPVTDLGNGSDDALWQSATDSVGYLRSGGTKIGNSAMYVKAVENGLLGLIRVNKDYNCGKIEGNDCVPIFKGSSVDDITAANGGTVPTDIAFIGMSKDAGEILESVIFNGTGTLAMDIDVTNDGTRTIYVPCGTIEGKSSDIVMVGGHHDTVYHGQGAIDDTSGSASVMEMARQISEIVNTTGTPERTLRFCTWGGEEEGLYGSKAYVEENKEFLKDHLRLYVNLDMNHVDADTANRGNSVSLFTNNQDDFEHIERITKLYRMQRSDVAEKYDIGIQLLDGAKGDQDGMPYNSDHGPFVYDLGDSTRGRAVVCYGSGSWEYHTYLDTMDRFNPESLGVSVTIYGTYVRLLAYNADV